jgi:hypothetical protein
MEYQKLSASSRGPLPSAACHVSASLGSGSGAASPAAAPRTLLHDDGLGLAPRGEGRTLLVRVVALRERPGRIPHSVVAHRVRHVARPERAHVSALLRRHHGVVGRHEPEEAAALGALAAGTAVAAREAERRVDAAAAQGEVGELGHERRVLVVDLVLAPVRGPGGAVPDGSVHRHRLRREVAAHARVPDHLTDRRVVDVEAGTRIRSRRSAISFCARKNLLSDGVVLT